MLKPPSATQAIYPQREDSAASAFRAALDLMAANCRFLLASQGIATAAANKIPIPTRLRRGSRYIWHRSWADPAAAALALVPLIVREGWEAVRSSRLGCQCP